MENVLEIQNVSKRFGNFKALDDISLSIKRGEIYGLIGENGAGKTTLMRLITKLSPLRSGKITLLGDNLRVTNRPLKHIGSIIESPACFQNLTVIQNLKLTSIQHGISNKSLVANIIELVGLELKKNTKAKNLSLGQRQRLGLAIALLPQPDFLILDEPINGLDPSGIMDIRALLKKLNSEMNTTILISSHILTELYQVSTRFGFIHRGRLIKELSKEELESANKSGIEIELDQVEQAAQVLDGLNIGEFSISDDHHVLILDLNANIAEINNQLVQNNIPVKNITKKESSLEQYYTNLLAEQGGF
jgi:ABC-2 type transport system ATP-binding protein